MNNFTVAIAGIPGSGKTSVAERLTAILEDAVTLYFDHYEIDGAFPEDNAQWLTDGADPYAFDTPQLLIDLAQLRSGRSIDNPFTKERVNPARFIVLEEPFGRTRKDMKEMVDFVACIDVSPDLALARHLLRDIAYHKTHAEPEKILNWAMKRLEGYLEKSGRAVFLKVNEWAMSDCDIILDGEKSVEESAQQVAQIVLVKAEETGP